MRLIEIDIKDFDEGLKNIQDKVHSKRLLRNFIKWVGVFVMVGFLFTKLWFHAFIMWILFFPDSEEIIRWFKQRILHH